MGVRGTGNKRPVANKGRSNIAFVFGVTDKMDLRVELLDGEAEAMGEGVFVVRQTDERGAVQSVVLTSEDLRRMCEHPSSSSPR